tara:strand:+ start:89 stop:400 length:312 start_codon:yes stop_codon:yes gene_type:complete
MQLPATGSYQLTRPSEIPAVNWDKADSPNGFSSSSIKADWESGEHEVIHGYIQIGLVSGAEASYSALHIQQALDNFSHIASHSGYNMSGSILWKDNEAHHPFS